MNAVRRRQTGVTLLELMIVMAITAVLAGGITYAFSAELQIQRLQEARRADVGRSDATEREIRQLLQGAKLSTSATDTTTFFQGIAENGAGDLGAGRITFTTSSMGVPVAAQFSADDFETQQQARGPVGGLAEVSLGTTPVGDAGARAGLFERAQRPSDGDPTQGGLESVLNPNVDRIGFQFWDGAEWVAAWDTTTMTPRRLPEAVQVSYTLKSATAQDAGAVHVFIVFLPASDVNAQNPVTSGGTG